MNHSLPQVLERAAEVDDDFDVAALFEGAQARSRKLRSRRRASRLVGALTVCAAARPDDATVTQPAATRIPPRIRQLTANPRTALIPSPMRYAPFLSMRPPPLRIRQTVRAGTGELFTAFFRPCKRTPAQTFPFPSKSCPSATVRMWLSGGCR